MAKPRHFAVAMGRLGVKSFACGEKNISLRTRVVSVDFYRPVDSWPKKLNRGHQLASGGCAVYITCEDLRAGLVPTPCRPIVRRWADDDHDFCEKDEVRP